VRVFVAGGTGAIGRHLIPELVADGHQVTASTRSACKSADLAAAGAVPVVMDGLDRDAVLAAVQKARHDHKIVIVSVAWAIHCGHMLPGAQRGRTVAISSAVPGRSAV
jgi:uncharacterized protein YbjT (DUF2867 family)